MPKLNFEDPGTLEATNLRNVLFNMAERSGTSDEYRHGIIVGVTSTLISTGLTFNRAIELIADYLPNGARLIPNQTVPLSWWPTLTVEMLRRGKKWINPV